MSENKIKKINPNSHRSKGELAPISSDSLPPILDIRNVPAFVSFVKWYATPGQFREPENQKGFAELVGVCEDTLTDWKRNPQFWPLVQQALNLWVKERIPDVMGGLYLKTQGDKCCARDVEMFLRLGGMDIHKK